MTSTNRMVREKIEENKRKLLEEKEEAIRIEKEKQDSLKPLISKDDLLGAIKELVTNTNNEVESTLLEYKTSSDSYQEEIEGKIESKFTEFKKSLKSLENKISSIEIPDISPLANKTELEGILSQIEAVKKLIPKDKKITIKDIEGLTDVVNQLANSGQVSQPITIDILDSGDLIKSGASKLNFTNAVITTQGNTVNIDTTAGGSAVWGAITGTLSNQTDLQNALNAKQDTLVSGVNIKTVNGVSVLGAGDIPLPNGTSIQSVSSDTTITLSDGTTVLFVDASGGNVNITLPTPTANTGQYVITKIDSSINTVTVIGAVNGIVNPTIDFQDESWTLSSNGTSYRII